MPYLDSRVLFTNYPYTVVIDQSCLSQVDEELFVIANVTPAPHAASHGASGSDPVTLAISQVTGLQSALDGKIDESLATAADQGLYSTAPSTWSVFSLQSWARSLLGSLKANWNESLGIFKAYAIEVDTAPAAIPPGSPGRMIWNDTTGTIEFQLKGGNVTLEIGQEQIIRVKNDEGSPLAVGDVVYLSGANGSHALVKKASALNDQLSAYTIGMVVEAMSNNGQGWVAISGYVHDINTNHLTEGAPVWLSTVAGQTTSTKPTPPNHSVFLGMCVRKNTNVGSILLAIQNGYELDELHDVLITSPTTGQTIIWDNVAKLWKNHTLTAADVSAIPSSYLDTDGTLAANSDLRVATQKATKTYVDTAVTGLLDFKGATDCSGNPNYPAALKGDSYVVSVAGKIGGASGTSVDIGDVYFATADNAGGTQAAVGASWNILEHNLQGALLSANNLSDVANTTTARTNLGLGSVATLASDTDGTLTANSDTRVATQKATKTYADTKVSDTGDTMTGTLYFNIPGTSLALQLKDNANLTRYMDIFCGGGACGFYGYGTQDLWFGASGTAMVKIQSTGNIGIGLAAAVTPFYRVHNAIAFAKTDTTQRQAWFMSTNETAAGSPFGALFSITGAAALANRIYDISTTDYAVAWGGNIVIQRYGGNVGIRTGNTVPTAYLLLGAGSTAASSAPLKFTSGSLMTTPEAGAVEFLTDKAYLTITTGAARKELTLNDAALTSGQQPTTTTNGRLTNSNKYSIYATGTTNGAAGSAVNLTIATLPTSGDLRFARITVKAKSAAAMPDIFGRTLDAMWGNGMGTLTQVGTDQLGTALTVGNLAAATIATSASGTTLRVTCTDVTGCGATVTWEAFGEYY